MKTEKIQMWKTREKGELKYHSLIWKRAEHLLRWSDFKINILGVRIVLLFWTWQHGETGSNGAKA